MAQFIRKLKIKWRNELNKYVNENWTFCIRRPYLKRQNNRNRGANAAYIIRIFCLFSLLLLLVLLLLRFRRRKKKWKTKNEVCCCCCRQNQDQTHTFACVLRISRMYSYIRIMSRKTYPYTSAVTRSNIKDRNCRSSRTVIRLPTQNAKKKKNERKKIRKITQKSQSLCFAWCTCSIVIKNENRIVFTSGIMCHSLSRWLIETNFGSE